MMFIHLQVTFHANGKVNAAVLANLLQHVVKETKPGGNIAPTTAVQIEADKDIRLFRRAAHLGNTFSGKQKLSYPVPIGRGQHTICFQVLFLQYLFIVLKQNSLAAQIFGQFYICSTVADDKTVRQVIVSRHIFSHHSGTRFAGWGIIFGKAAVYQDIIECDTLPFQCLQHQIMHRPESIFRERIRSQSVLIGNHDKLIIQLAPNEAQITEHFGTKLQFLERVELIIHRRLHHQRTITVYE